MDGFLQIVIPEIQPILFFDTKNVAVHGDSVVEPPAKLIFGVNRDRFPGELHLISPSHFSKRRTQGSPLSPYPITAQVSTSSMRTRTSTSKTPSIRANRSIRDMMCFKVSRFSG